MELCCNSPLHQGVLGKQVAVPQGKRKPQVGRLLCCLCQPCAVVRSGSCVAPHKSPQFLWAGCCVSPDVLGGCSQGEVEHAGLMSGAPRGASCALPPRSAPLPCSEGEGGHMDASCGPASAPHPTPQKGEVSVRRKSAPCLSFDCSSHIFCAAGSPSPLSLCWLPG